MSLGNSLPSLLILIPLLLIAPAAQEPAPSSSSSRGSVSGIVLDENGKPLSEATVYAVLEADFKRQFHTQSNDKGEFTLGNLPEGLVYLSGFKENDGYPYDFFSFFASPGQNTPVKVQIKGGESEKNVRIQLGEKAARINIEIITKGGKPFQGSAGLVFTRPDQPGRPYNRGTGSFESLLVPAVPFHLMVLADGYKDWHYGGNPSGLISLRPGDVFAVSVRLEKLSR